MDCFTLKDQVMEKDVKRFKDEQQPKVSHNVTT